MAAPSWIQSILGLTTLLTGNGQTTQRRQVLKVIGIPVFDDGVQTVLGGVQTITGSGAWDGKSAALQVKGTGTRTITFGDPDATLQYEGFEFMITDFAGNSTGGNLVTVDPGGSVNGSASNISLAQNGCLRLKWRAVGNWQNVS